MDVRLVKQPEAIVPIVMSAAALGLVLGHLALYGVTRGGDEGAAAHVWQLLMAGQVPVIAFHAVKWFPRAPQRTFWVVVAQLAAALAATAPVFLLEL